MAYWASIEQGTSSRLQLEPDGGIGRGGQAEVEAGSRGEIHLDADVAERRAHIAAPRTAPLSAQAMLNMHNASAPVGSREDQDERTALLPRRRRINWTCLSVAALAVLAIACYLALVHVGAGAKPAEPVTAVFVSGGKRLPASSARTADDSEPESTASPKAHATAPEMSTVQNDLSIKWDKASLERWCEDALSTADALTRRMKRCTACGKPELLTLLNSQAVLLDNVEYMVSLMEQVHPDQTVRQAAR